MPHNKLAGRGRERDREGYSVSVEMHMRGGNVGGIVSINQLLKPK